MKVSIEYIEQKVREFNAQMFGGELPPLQIRLSSARTFLGKLRYEKKRKLLGGWSYKNFQLIISNRFDLPERVIEDTIIHEMIHHYIMYRRLKDTSSHGVIFREMMKQINEQYNRNISVTVRLTDDIVRKDTKKRIHLLCVSHFSDGRVGITLSSRTRLQYLCQALPKIPGITNCTWYITDNPFFNRYPRSLTPKIYRITQSELDENLHDAQPISISSELNQIKVLY